MNLFFFVEGEKTEPIVYKHWVSHLNKKLSIVDTIWNIKENNFSIFSGKGYPAYFDKIENAIYDVNKHGKIDKLILSVDSEEMTFNKKKRQVEKVVSGFKCKAEIIIIVQHFCIEAWFLGNKMFCPTNPNSQPLINYMRHYNVRINDPEGLRLHSKFQFKTRAKFANNYLRKIFEERKLRYLKRNPSEVVKKDYLNQLTSRRNIDGHIKSLDTFLGIFNN